MIRNYGVCRTCGKLMLYEEMEEERPHGDDEWHPECCPKCNDQPEVNA